MITPQFILPIASELVIDLFAGGGGASTGIEQAIGRHVDIAVNHDPEAVSLHEANHPQTRHFVSDVFEVDPLTVTAGQQVGLLWASPDCKHFSKAKGGKPVSKKIRGLAWVVVKWAKLVRPRLICLENVEEFQTWGPLGADNRPCPQRRGSTFARWKKQLENLGYVIEHRELRACDYGAPTIRKRLFLVARRDGHPIVWPEATHGAPDSLPVKTKKLKAWRTAAECIDWSLPAPSIFERGRPLADATCRRIAKGIMRYVINAAEPFIVNTRNGEREGQQPRTRSIHEPYWTVTGLGSQGAVVAPILTEHANASTQRTFRADEPLRTQVAQVKGGHFALVAAFMAKHYGGVVGHELHGEPVHTVTAADHNSLVTANLVHYHADKSPQDVRASDLREPLKTQTTENRHAVVHSFLVKYYSEGGQDASCADPMHTVPTKDRMGLVMVHGQPYAIVDIGMRMLTPRELYRAQGFPESYQIDRGADGRALTKTAQVRMCGNSVCPPLARAIVAANYSEAQMMRAAA